MFTQTYRQKNDRQINPMSKKPISTVSPDIIVNALKDCEVRMNLQFNRCRGQCFDGPANMAGCKNGVWHRSSLLIPELSHCYVHLLNLAYVYVIHQKVQTDAFDVTNELVN